MPIIRHEDVRDELFAGLSVAGRLQLERFASLYAQLMAALEAGTGLASSRP